MPTPPVSQSPVPSESSSESDLLTSMAQVDVPHEPESLSTEESKPEESSRTFEPIAAPQHESSEVQLVLIENKSNIALTSLPDNAIAVQQSSVLPRALVIAANALKDQYDGELTRKWVFFRQRKADKREALHELLTGCTVKDSSNLPVIASVVEKVRANHPHATKGFFSHRFKDILDSIQSESESDTLSSAL